MRVRVIGLGLGLGLGIGLGLGLGLGLKGASLLRNLDGLARAEVESRRVGTRRRAAPQLHIAPFTHVPLAADAAAVNAAAGLAGLSRLGDFVEEPAAAGVIAARYRRVEGHLDDHHRVVAAAVDLDRVRDDITV